MQVREEHAMGHDSGGAACHSAETKLISTLPILREPRARAHVRSC